MAMLTTDRDVPFKVQPLGTYNHYELADGVTIYANSLAILNSDEQLEPATDSGSGSVVYAPKRYTEDNHNMDFDSQAGGPQLAKVLSGVIAILDSAGLTKADVGARVFVDDDHTVTPSADEEDETRPFAGVIQKVISATEAEVYIPGTLN